MTSAVYHGRKANKSMVYFCNIFICKIFLDITKLHLPLFGLFLEYLDLDVPGFSSSSDEWILPLAMFDLHFLGLREDFQEPPCLARVILSVALEKE